MKGFAQHQGRHFGRRSYIYAIQTVALFTPFCIKQSYHATWIRELSEWDWLASITTPFVLTIIALRAIYGSFVNNCWHYMHITIVWPVLENGSTVQGKFDIIPGLTRKNIFISPGVREGTTETARVPHFRNTSALMLCPLMCRLRTWTAANQIAKKKTKTHRVDSSSQEKKFYSPPG